MQALNKGILLNNTNLLVDESADLHMLNQSGFTTGADPIMPDDQQNKLGISLQGSHVGARQHVMQSNQGGARNFHYRHA